VLKSAIYSDFLVKEKNVNYKFIFFMKKIVLFFSVCMLTVMTTSAQSGTCGANLTWTLSDGTLTISGEGAMDDWDYVDDYGVTNPWYSHSHLIQSIVIGNEVSNIGDWAFSDCNSLASITIPSGVKRIGAAAFSNCSSLISIIIPNGVERIGDRTFYRCRSLNSITIPESVTSIGDGAFEDCSNLISITIPSGVTRIGKATFEDCIGLTSVTISSGVTNIEVEAFEGCIGLTSITNMSSVPQSITSDVFNDVDVSKITLHVPSGSKELYKNADVWKDFNIVDDVPAGVEAVFPDEDFRIYSNPATGIVSLSQEADVKVYNLHGALLLHTFGAQIDLSGYTKGVYLLQVNGKTVKVINGN